MRKKSLSTALLALLTASAYAQGGDGIAGITEATSMVTSYFYPLVQLIYAIGAVTGLIGGCTRSFRRATPIRRRPQPVGSAPASS